MKNVPVSPDSEAVVVQELLQPICDETETYDLSEKDLPDGAIKYELNLMGLPIFSPNKRIPDHTAMKYVFNEAADEYLRIIPSNDPESISQKILQEFDEQIFYGLLKLFEMSGESVIDTDYPTLMNFSKVTNKSSNYLLRVKDSLERMKNCTLVFNKVYYDPVAKNAGDDFIKRTKRINLISTLETISFEKFQEMSDSKDRKKFKRCFEKHGNIKEIVRITLNPDIVENINLKGFKYVQLEDLISIKNPTARKIYIMLTKWSHWEKGDRIKRKIKFLASRIPLSWKKQNIPSTIKNIIKACEYLKNIDRIKKFTLIERKPLKESLIEFHLQEDRLRRHNNKIGNVDTGHEQLEIIDIMPEQMRVVDNNCQVPDDLLKMIPAKFKKSTLEIAGEIFKAKGKDALLWYLEYAKPKAKSNFAGYLRVIYEKQLWEKYLEEEKEIEESIKAAEEQEILRKNETEKVVKIQEAKEKKIRQQRKRNIDLLNDLSEVESEKLRVLAKDSLPENLRDKESSIKMQMRAMVEDYINSKTSEAETNI